MDIGTIITVAAALIGGGATKKISKSRGSQAHKGAAPLAAILAAIAAQGAQHGSHMPAGDLIASGGQLGVWAVFLHSFIKNLTQLVVGLGRLKGEK